MFRNWSITWRLSVSVLAVTAVILAAVIGYGYVVARQILEQELEAKAWQLSFATTNRIQTVETAVRKLAGGLAAEIEVQAPQNGEYVYRLLERLVMDNEEVFGAAVALEPKALGYSESYTAPYVFRAGNRSVRDELGKKANPYFIQDWYALPQMMKRPVWSEPYRAESGGNALMVSYSVPIYDSGGAFLGVVTCNISLSWMAEMLQALPLGREGYAFLLSRNGTFITHPQKAMILKENIFSQAETENNTALRSMGRDMVRGEAGFIEYGKVQPGQNGWLLYQPIAVTGWSLGIFFSEAELMAKVAELSRKEGYIGVAGFLFLLPMLLFVARSITGPLRKLAEATRTLAAGDLSAPLPEIPGQDEGARLAGAFSQMRDELKRRIAMLADAATAKERIESELRIARSIQMELVPKTFPPFPARTDFELYATMVPAREVGGDFYDFMMPDEDHLWIVIGDVSGKGIAAALFMAVTRTFLRAFVQEDPSPGNVMRRVNDELSINNEANMFVTLFCGVVHLPTGQFCWANGGHNLPFLMTVDGCADFLPKTSGTLVGAMEGMRFAESTLTLNPGDAILLYTDGVTEAMNSEGQLFGNEPTRQALAALQDKNCSALVEGMQEALTAFVGGAEQSDDITMLAFRYFGAKK